MSINSSTEMPKGITQGYAKSFRETLIAAAMPKIFTFQELDDLDNAELKAVIEAVNPVKLGHEAA